MELYIIPGRTLYLLPQRRPSAGIGATDGSHTISPLFNPLMSHTTRPSDELEPVPSLSSTSRPSQPITNPLQTQLSSSLRHLAVSFLPGTPLTPPFGSSSIRLVSQPAGYQDFSSRARKHRRRNSSSPVRFLYVQSDDNHEESISEAPRSNLSSMTIQDDILQKMKRLLETEESYRLLLRTLRDKTLAQAMIDYCQLALEDKAVFESELGKALLVFMERLSKLSGALPSSYDLGYIKITDEELVCSGAFGDIHKTQHRGKSVCVKKIRVVGLAVDDEKTKKLHKKLVNEGILWWQLRHPNVLPLYGICAQPVLPYLVSPWMEHGDINAYLKSTPNTNRYLLLEDVLKGLAYLHNLNLIHGDLKGPNILVDYNGHATLADFGLSSVFGETIPKWESQSSAASKGGTRRWQAPELFDPTGDKVPHNTKESDIYAWACVCYEVFIGKLPFYEIHCDMVMFRVMNGEQPTRPQPDDDAWRKWGLREHFWSDMMEKCWARNPSERPTVQKLLNDIRGLAGHDTRSPPCEHEPATKDRSLDDGGHVQQLPISLREMVVQVSNDKEGENSDFQKHIVDAEVLANENTNC